MSILVSIAIVTLVFSAFFSGVEIAFVSANKLKLEIDKTSVRFPSNIINFFSKNESDFITTMLLGNNISLVVYGIVMTKILTPKFSIYIDSERSNFLNTFSKKDNEKSFSYWNIGLFRSPMCS